MTATDQMRTMLAELMGSSAGDPNAPSNRPKYNDKSVCRPYLFGACHHDILASTRMDLGECPKLHDPALRADYEREADQKDHFYDIDAFENLDRFLIETDRKMETARNKLQETQHELSDEASAKAEIVLAINEDLGKILAEAERLGSVGQVDESLKMMATVEEIKQKKSAAEADYRSSIPPSAIQQQKLRVCSDCGAYLGIHDNDRRLADHFGGKLHMGFVDLRERHAELKTTHEERKAARRTAEGGSSSSRDRDRGSHKSSSSRRRSRSRERTKRSRSRERSKRSRSRERSKRSRRSRSRDRDEGGRSTHKSSRHQSSRHRSRSREGREKKRSRHHSRSRSPRQEKKRISPVPTPVELPPPPPPVEVAPPPPPPAAPQPQAVPVASKKVSSILLFRQRLEETARQKQEEERVGVTGIPGVIPGLMNTFAQRPNYPPQ